MKFALALLLTMAIIFGLSVTSCNREGKDGAEKQELRSNRHSISDSDLTKLIDRLGPIDVPIPSENELLTSILSNTRGSIPTFAELGYKPSKDGISTGYVFFLGHFIPPPYKFSSNKGTGACYMNGIEISPGSKYRKQKRSAPTEGIQDIFTEVHWREVISIVEETMETELRKRGIKPFQKNRTINWKHVIDSAKATIQETKGRIAKYAELEIHDDRGFLVKWRSGKVTAAGIEFDYFVKSRATQGDKKSYEKSDKENLLRSNQFACKETIVAWTRALEESNGIIAQFPGSIGQEISENDAKEMVSIVNNKGRTVFQKKIELDRLRHKHDYITEKMILMILAVDRKGP